MSTITGTLTGNISGTAPAGSLTGTTLASNVVTSSLTSVGTLGSLSVTNAGSFGNLLSLGSSTLQNFTFVNATGTAATTTSLAISSIVSKLLKTNANGSIIGATAGVDYQAVGSYRTSAIQTLGDTYHTGLTGTTQTLATSTADTNLGLTIVSSGTAH